MRFGHRVLLLGVLVLSACSKDTAKTTTAQSTPPPSSTTASASASSAAPTTISLPQDGEPVELGPENFSVTIDNPYWSMKPGTRWVYEETENGETQRVEVVVTSETKMIAGVQAVVVHDVVTLGGATIEDTFDWYAQDKAGNVWYLGEDTTKFEDDGTTSKEGSWEHGVDGAFAGVIMPAQPQRGSSFRQEYYEGHAEDVVEILSTDASAMVPFGSFDHMLQTEDTTPLEPDVVEHKFYVKGVGPVLTINVSSGGSREELVEFQAGA